LPLRVCINSFSRNETGNFVRARYEDLEDFFNENYDLKENDENLNRIRAVLRGMEKGFGDRAEVISSRAVAVSAFLFCEQLYVQKEVSQIGDFGEFYASC
jgi:hypothetical protein